MTINEQVFTGAYRSDPMERDVFILQEQRKTGRPISKCVCKYHSGDLSTKQRRNLMKNGLTTAPMVNIKPDNFIIECYSTPSIIL